MKLETAHKKTGRKKTGRKRTTRNLVRSWQVTLLGLVTVLAASCGGGGGNGSDTAPAAPSNVQAAAQPGYVQVTWEDNSDNETGFALYRAPVQEGAAGDFTRLGEVAENTTNYRDTQPLNSNQSYLYSVSALGENGESVQVQTDLSTAVTPVPADPSDTFTLRISFEGPGRGTVESQEGSVACSEPGAAGCTATLPTGTSLTLSAKASAGAEFEGWSGEGCSGEEACDLTVAAASDSDGDGTVEVTAAFAQTGYGLILRKEGNGGGTFKSSPSGIDCGDDCEEAYGFAADEATTVGFGKEDIILNEGSLFNAWAGDCPETNAEDSCNVVMDQNRTVVAHLSKPANDSYDVQNGQALTVGASAGLLSNELLGAAEAGDDLKVFSDPVSPPQNGRVTLRNDGSFTYTPDDGFDGTDTFTYRVTDLRDNTAQATVSLSVSSSPQVTLSVEKAGDGAGTVSSQPGGIACGDDCEQAYAEGTTVTLSANPAEGSTFASWGGACSGSGSCDVTLDEAKTVTATFEPAEPQTFALTVNKLGDGAGTVTSQPGGISCGVDCREDYEVGTTVSLSTEAAEGSTFTGWGEACSGTGACDVTLDEAKTVTATFTESATNTPPTAETRDGVTVPQGERKKLFLLANDEDDDPLTFEIVDGPSKGTLELTGDDDDDSNDSSVFYTADLGADGEDSFTFKVNDGQADSNVATMNLVLTNRLTVAAADNGSVSANDAPAGDCTPTVGGELCGDYRVGIDVTLQTEPDAGFVFSRWQGACEDQTETCTLTMDSPKDTSATFTQPAQTFEVNVRLSGAGSGRVTSTPPGIDCLDSGESCKASFAAGAQVTLEAEPAGITSAFKNWRRACRGEEPSCKLDIDEDKNVVARFQTNNLRAGE